jgi:hypothetical protein
LDGYESAQISVAYTNPVKELL